MCQHMEFWSSDSKIFGFYKQSQTSEGQFQGSHIWAIKK